MCPNFSRETLKRSIVALFTPLRLETSFKERPESPGLNMSKTRNARSTASTPPVVSIALVLSDICRPFETFL